MKKDILKYVFIFFAIVIVIYATYVIRNQENNVKIDSDEDNQVVETIEQTLRIGIVSYDAMNPIISNNKYVQNISKLIYEPLISISSDYKIEMCLAKEWAKTSDTTYVIKLRDNVKWSDGELLTADDVLYTFDRLKEFNNIYTNNVENVIQVDVLDSNTVKITLSEEVPFFEYNLSFPIMSRKYFGNEDFKNSDRSKTPIGTGPYKVFNRTNSTLELAKNENWWNKENKESRIEKIKINLYSSVGELYNDFKLGKLDFLNSELTNVSEYIGTIGYNVIETGGREFCFLAINMQNPVLSNKEVRQAIMYGINKDEIVSTVSNNKYKIAEYPIQEDNWLSVKKTENIFNAEKAKEILEKNGWQYKNKYWQKTINYYYRRLSFNLVVNSSNNTSVKTAEIIKNNLDYIGIRINIIKANQNQFNNYIKNKNYDLIINEKYLSVNPNISSFVGENNLANYNNEEVKTLLNEIKNISDDKLLKEKFSKIYTQFMEDVPYIGLYNNYSMIAYSKELLGTMSANWNNIFYNINTWSKKK